MDDGVEVLDDISHWGNKRIIKRVSSSGHVEKTLIYHRSAVVLLPKANLFEALLNIDYENCINDMLKSFKLNSYIDLANFQALIKSQNKSPRVECVLDMIPILEYLENSQLAVDFIVRFGACIRKFNMESVYAKLANLVSLFDWTLFIKSLDGFMLPVKEENLAGNLCFVEV